MKMQLKMRLRNRRPLVTGSRVMTRDMREWPLRDIGEQLASEQYHMTPAGKALLASIAREEAREENLPWPDGSRFPYPDLSKEEF